MTTIDELFQKTIDKNRNEPILSDFAWKSLEEYDILRSINPSNPRHHAMLWMLRAMANPDSEEGAEIVYLLFNIHNMARRKREWEQARQHAIDYRNAGHDVVQELCDLLDNLDVDDDFWQDSLDNPYH